MADHGVRVTDKPTDTSADQVVGVKNGSVVRVPFYDLARQLRADGPVAEGMATNETLIASVGARVDTMEKAVGYANIVAQTWSDLSVLSGSQDGQGAQVLDADTGTHTDPVTAATVANAGVYTWVSAAPGWKRIGDTLLAGKMSASDYVGPGKNLVNPSQIRAGYYYSPSSDAIIQSGAYRSTGFIPVEPGETYTIQGVEPGMTAVTADAASDTANFAGFVTLDGRGVGTITIPAGYPFLVVALSNSGSDDTSFDGTAQVEIGDTPTAHEAYRLIIADTALPTYLTETNGLITYDSFNKVDPARVNHTKRYSTGNKSFVTDLLGIAASDWIAVEEGQFYCLSGDGVYTGWQGGFFSGYGNLAAVANITFAAPPTGDGRIFQVPTGAGITHVVVSLRKLNDDPAATELHGDAQLELGEVATAHQPFELEKYVNAEMIPVGAAGAAATPLFDAALWYKFVEADEGSPDIDKLLNFRAKWLSRDADLCVVNTGTSLTARSLEHCTEHPDAARRPPLMHSMNFATHIWDRLAWDNQHYARYDLNGIFSETASSWLTTNDMAEWDDAAYRNGLTRLSDDTGAGVTFTVPTTAWQFNFIYRTDSTGAPAAVTVAEGNGQMEVWNGSAWVEANGFAFSMAEAAPVTRSITIPLPQGGTTTETIASKGNTTYQKRLKMRCKSGAIDSRATTKSVTIAGTGAGRFMYWGYEWSPREFMVTYINAARGSHNTQATSAFGLPRFQDNEIWSFAPDLLLFELPIHNDGAAAAGSYPGPGYWASLTNNFVFNATYELALKTRAAEFQLSPEFAMFTASIAWGFDGIAEDGTLIAGEQGDGRMMTALDKYNEAYSWVTENHPDAVCINAAMRWVTAANTIFGDLKTATEGSGKTGVTFTNEGAHWNNTGAKIMAKAVLPLLNFTNG